MCAKPIHFSAPSSSSCSEAVLLESLESLLALKRVQLVHDVDAKVVQESIAGPDAIDDAT